MKDELDFALDEADEKAVKARTDSLKKSLREAYTNLKRSKEELESLSKLSNGYIDQLTKEEAENASLRKEIVSIKEAEEHNITTTNGLLTNLQDSLDELKHKCHVRDEAFKSSEAENASLKKRNSELLKSLSDEKIAHSLLKNRLARIRASIREILKKKVSKAVREALVEIFRTTEQ